ISNSKNLRMGKLALLILKKKLMDDPTGPLASVQSSGSELSELLSGYHTIFEVRKRHSVSNYRSMAVLEGNLPAGLNTGRSLKCYAFHEVSDNLEDHPNGSCRSKHSRSKKNSGKANRTLTAKTGKK
ncbi:hypothetical protein MKW94_002939, partial [Papaver nudicaule]|nr:hypothetical protein [Papaver nudicaule]